MSDNLTASLSVGVIYSGDGSGLTPEQEEQLNKIPMIEQSVEEITNDLNSKANISDIPTAIETYVTAHRDELKGETGSAGKDGINAVNPNFTIGTVTTLEPNESPTVTLSGTYPNLVLNFGIPRGAGQTVDTTEYMYYGRISLEEAGGKVIQYSEITPTMITTARNVRKVTASTLGKTSGTGVASQTAEGDYLVVVVPTSKNYTVTKDNGIGGKVQFSESTSGSANGVDITIDNIAYKLYGEILLSQSQLFIYID